MKKHHVPIVIHLGPEWVSVQNRTPIERADYLVIVGPGDMLRARWDGARFVNDAGADVAALHWRPVQG